jgi:hypothetical protein
MRLIQSTINPDGTVINVPQPWTRETLAAALAEYRYEKEIAGITCGGIPISTERGDHRTVMHTIRTEARSDPGFVAPLKTAAGFVSLNAEAIMNVTDAMLWYINACFVRESELLTAMATTDDLDSIAAEMVNGWPTREF